MRKPNPEDAYGVVLADMFLNLCKAVGKDSRLCAEFNYRDGSGFLKMQFFLTVAGKAQLLTGKDAIRVEKLLDPQFIDQMNKFCAEIFNESGASGIRVKFEFTFRSGKGHLSFRTFITPDGTTERLLDSDVLMPRGSKLQRDAEINLRKVFCVGRRRH